MIGEASLRDGEVLDDVGDARLEDAGDFEAPIPGERGLVAGFLEESFLSMDNEVLCDEVVDDVSAPI